MVSGGIILGKRYEIVSKIGAGGMADVYKGRDVKLNRYVAIKVLKKEYQEDADFVRKFRSEAQAAAGLLHPNIVNVYDAGEDRGLYYIVMELVEGITLKEYIKRKGKLSHKEIVNIAVQMCNGIGCAHAADIIHRDIKPQNIIISKDGKVKVTDFGIAKATTSHTVSSNAMGSVHYTSPEQARGRFSDAKSDIYSIGITLFEMATGRLPFVGDSTVTVAIKHLQEEITPPSEYVPDLPYSLEQIILKCTQKNGQRRYNNTDELVRDLKRSLVDPDGDFVVIPPLQNADTVIITDEELDNIRDNYDGDADDDYDDDYDNDDSRYRNRDETSEDVNPRMKKIMKILTVVVIAIIVFILIFAIGKAAGIFKSFGGNTADEETEEEVEVPSLLGMTEEEAKEEAKKYDLGIRVTTQEESTQYEKGQICSQTPEAGEKVEKNTTIKVVLSSKLVSEEITVPDVAGSDEDSARKTLEEAGFTVGTPNYVYDGSVGEGEVISTDPEAGASVASGTEIIMNVSKGTKKVTVPSVVGKSESSAKSTLSDLGLKSTVTTEYSNSVDQGIVISQSISKGTKVAAGTTVSLVVSSGEKPEEKVSVPDLSGQTLQGAKSLLESKGLTLVDGGQEISNVAIGKVTRWSPSGSVKKGTQVTVWISSGSGTENNDSTDSPSNTEDPAAQPTTETGQDTVGQ